MHIALLNVFFAPHSYGGATVVAEQVAQELKQSHGCRITAISAIERADLEPYRVMCLEQGGIRNYVITLPLVRDGVDLFANPRVEALVQELLADIAPDLVHIHCLQDLSARLVPLARAQAPVILSTHDYWWICARQFMIRTDGKPCRQDPINVAQCRVCVPNQSHLQARHALLFDSVAAADLVSFPSRFAHDLALRSAMPAQKTVVWENGVRGPAPGFFAQQKARRAADPTLVFGFLGGPTDIKGWPLIRRAFEQIDRSDFHGLLVDASLDGTWWRDHSLHRLRGTWQIHPRFSQAEMDAFYAKIDVLLFPSQWNETFGLTIREARARGIRIIQTRAGGAMEWDGADPSDMLAIGDGPEALIPKLHTVLDTPQAHPRPTAALTYAAQAEQFFQFAAPLVQRAGKAAGRG